MKSAEVNKQVTTTIAYTLGMAFEVSHRLIESILKIIVHLEVKHIEDRFLHLGRFEETATSNRFDANTRMGIMKLILHELDRFGNSIFPVSEDSRGSGSDAPLIASQQLSQKLFIHDVMRLVHPQPF